MLCQILHVHAANHNFFMQKIGQNDTERYDSCIFLHFVVPNIILAGRTSGLSLH